VLIVLASLAVFAAALSWITVISSRPQRARRSAPPDWATEGLGSIDEQEAEIRHALSDPVLVHQARRRVAERRRREEELKRQEGYRA
jgi:hypothetical protein